MTSRRIALLVACDNYSDPELQRLRAPLRDVAQLADVLKNKDIGNFDDMNLLVNRSHAEVERAIETLCQGCQRADTVLLYFSCHGTTDEDGQLLFAMNDTHSSARASTSLSAQEVSRHLSRCKAAKQIVILDCCYSGAYAQAIRPKSYESQPVSVNTGKYFTRNHSGNGLFILTASDSVTQSYERDEASLFTASIVEGLRLGVADLDGDGLVTMDELYDYVFKRMSSHDPPLRPRKWALGVEGTFWIAKSTGLSAQPCLPPIASSEEPTVPPSGRRRSGPRTAPISGRSASAPPPSNREPRKRARAADRSASARAAAPSAQSLPPVSGQVAHGGSAQVKSRRSVWPVAISALALIALGAGSWGYRGGFSLPFPRSAPKSTPLPTEPAGRKPAEPASRPNPTPPQRIGGAMVQIMGGKFSLGSTDPAAHNPLHSVLLGPFEIDIMEVTVAAYSECVKARSCTQPARSKPSGYCNWGVRGRETHPINCVNYSQAEQFCEWAGKRLPTEDEWELAARGQDGRTYPWGEQQPGPTEGNGCGQGCKLWQKKPGQVQQAQAIEPDGMLGTAPVGSFIAGRSPYGLLDVAGNVWEWAQPMSGSTDSRRPVFGGSWQSAPQIHFRADRRHAFPAEGQNGHTGFRCASALPTAAADATLTRRNGF